nr:hypothetical protein Iba_scaffold7103CG0820 [Ipomoea batatas]
MMMRKMASSSLVQDLRTCIMQVMTWIRILKIRMTMTLRRKRTQL